MRIRRILRRRSRGRGRGSRGRGSRGRGSRGRRGISQKVGTVLSCHHPAGATSSVLLRAKEGKE